MEYKCNNENLFIICRIMVKSALPEKNIQIKAFHLHLVKKNRLLKSTASQLSYAPYPMIKLHIQSVW